MTKLSLIHLMAIALSLSTTSAAPANPTGRLYDQPDGSTTPEIFLKGDQHYSWKTDKKGYSVIQDDQGWWVYAKQEDGLLVSSGVRVGYGNPKKTGLVINLKVDPSKRINSLRNQEDDVTREHRDLLEIPTSALCNFQGTANNPCRLMGLVVLIKFSDHQNRVLPSPVEYDILFNNNGPTADNNAPTGSVSDVFRENSYDSFVLQSTVTDWISVSRTEAQTVDGNYGLNMAGTRETWKQAMEMLESTLDLRQFDQDGDRRFDCLVLMHSGAAAETGGTDCDTKTPSERRIWSHATAQNWFTSKTRIGVNRFYVASAVWDTCPPGGRGTKWAIARIAVIAHECSHFLGLPDTYDTTGGAGLGSFDLLANMWGWYGTQYYPPLMSAWCKAKLGWVSVVHITSSDTYPVRQACTSNVVYRIDNNMPNGEYLLIENRYPCGFDLELKGYTASENRNGIAVWHVDESELQTEIHHQSEGRPGDGMYPRNHYLVALLQADGEYDLEKGLNRGDERDLFRASSDHPEVANKIGPNGVVLNNGQTKSYPNTNSYAKGVEMTTGITIEFGPPGSDMWMKVNLEGPAPTNAPTPSVTESLPTTTVTDVVGVTSNVPPECAGSPNMACFVFNGKIYHKGCTFIKRVKNEVCNLTNLKTGLKVRSKCGRSCRGA